jgi:hypothetical protein
MRTTARLSVVAAAAGILTFAGAPLAVAQSTAEYTNTEDTAVQDTSLTSGTKADAPAVQARTTPSTTSTPATLPFTGGEVVLIAAAGAAAVAAGAGLVVGGRRRATTAS